MIPTLAAPRRLKAMLPETEIVVLVKTGRTKRLGLPPSSLGIPRSIPLALNSVCVSLSQANNKWSKVPLARTNARYRPSGVKAGLSWSSGLSIGSRAGAALSKEFASVARKRMSAPWSPGPPVSSNTTTGEPPGAPRPGRPTAAPLGPDRGAGPPNAGGDSTVSRTIWVVPDAYRAWYTTWEPGVDPLARTSSATPFALNGNCCAYSVCGYGPDGKFVTSVA